MNQYMNQYVINHLLKSDKLPDAINYEPSYSTDKTHRFSRSNKTAGAQWSLAFHDNTLLWCFSRDATGGGPEPRWGFHRGMTDGQKPLVFPSQA